jgi:biopolymer transport protein ExbD
MSKISSGFVLFAVLMALSVGVAFSEVKANVTENATENATGNATMNATGNVTINATGNVTVIAENATIKTTEPVKA